MRTVCILQEAVKGCVASAMWSYARQPWSGCGLPEMTLFWEAMMGVEQKMQPGSGFFSSHPFSLPPLQANSKESTRKQNFFFFFCKGWAVPTVPWWGLYIGSAENSWSHVCWETCNGHCASDECATSQGNSAVFSPLTLHQLPQPCTGVRLLFTGKEEPVSLLMPFRIWSYRCHGQRKTGGGSEDRYLCGF